VLARLRQSVHACLACISRTGFSCVTAGAYVVAPGNISGDDADHHERTDRTI
jgi:hypothetical protein